jgi:general secretion pathway protein G
MRFIMRKKRAFTLLEIMIVIFLIGLIGSIVGYNMKGSLNKGKEFKTKEAAKRLQDMLELAYGEGKTKKEIEDHPEEVIKEQGLVKNIDQFLKDGWNTRFKIVVDETDGSVSVTSVHVPGSANAEQNPGP